MSRLAPPPPSPQHLSSPSKPRAPTPSQPNPRAPTPSQPNPRVTRGTLVRLAIAVLFFTAAPTAGDIGSCGQAPDDLDPAKFFSAKAELDCQRCHACGLTTQACVVACQPFSAQTEFPAHCYPLVHDGEVCLNALQASSCDDYRQYMNDLTPTIPTECNFCPPCNDAGAPDSGGNPAPRCE